MLDLRAKFIVFLLLNILLLTFSCKAKTDYREIKAKEGSIIISISELGDAVPSFFSYRVNGKVVNFFVLRLGDNIESYLDACMKCYPHKMGFRVDGFYLVCRYCNVRYPLDSLKEGAGSCFPIPLQGKTEGNKYVIDASLLKDSLKYF